MDGECEDCRRSRLLLRSAVAVRRAGGSAIRTLARCTCKHDGQRACGPVRGAFTTENDVTGAISRFVIDRRIVLQGMTTVDPGTWVAQILAPPNPEKGGEMRGWVDGLKVDVGADLRAEVLEVKSRRSGGCCLASREAAGYVDVLNGIAPQIKRVSELATANGAGLRATADMSARQVDEALRGAGIDRSTDAMSQAWGFYSSLQNALGRTFTTPFGAVSFKLYTGGTANQTYELEPPMLTFCKDKQGTFFGIERVVFQLNQRGGLSYGCQKTCDRNRERSAAEQQAIAAYEARKSGKADAPRAEIMYDPAEEADPLRPAAVTTLVPEMQAVPTLLHLINANLWSLFPAEPLGRRFYLVASPEFVAEVIGKPRARQTTEMLKARTTPAFGLGALAGTVVFWTYDVPMSIAIIVLTGAAAAEGVGVAEAAGVEGAGVAGTGLTLTELAGLGGQVANDNAIKVLATAAGVVLTLAIASPDASAAEGGWQPRMRFSVAAVPEDQLGAGHGIGDEVLDNGVTHVVIGTAEAR